MKKCPNFKQLHGFIKVSVFYLVYIQDGESMSFCIEILLIYWRNSVTREILLLSIRDLAQAELLTELGRFEYQLNPDPAKLVCIRILPN